MEDVASWHESEPQNMHTPVTGSLGAQGLPCMSAGTDGSSDSKK